MNPSDIAPTPAVTAALTRAVSNSSQHFNRSASLPRRFLASSRLAVDTIQVWTSGLDVVCREGVADLRQVSRDGEKVFDAAAECERVRPAQLAAYAYLLEDMSVYDEDVGTTVQCAQALLAGPDPLASLPLWALRVDVDAADAVTVIEKGMRVRDGVDPSARVVSGDLTVYNVSGPSQEDNVVFVWAMDACGDVVESAEEEDVSVRVEGDGVEHVRVSRVEDGVFECEYAVAAETIEPLRLSVSVCGTVLAGSPWMVQRSLDSVILPQVPSATQLAFLRELTSVWLPGLRSELLYRGSRDGMTPIAFHRLCDGKGPTLTLIRSDNGYTFGGYSSVSWSSPASTSFIPCPDAFVFSVEGPYGSVTKFPVKAGRGIGCHKNYGPIFDGGVAVGKSSGSSFDSTSVCHIGSGYVDVLGQGNKTLAAKAHFVPEEVEVYGVEVPSSL